ncbi:MAG: riboflavin synthase [Fidelibacterota bacterium]
MFTGLIEEVGKIKSIHTNKDGKELEISAEKVLENVQKGDSISIDGVCLSVTDFSNNYFRVQAVHESLRKSTLGKLQTGSVVNLERAMSAGGRFGGHIVQGHADGTGKIKQVRKFQNSAEIEIVIPAKLMKYIVAKGSIAISGISLTVAEKHADSITIAVIPITFADTSLSRKRIGDPVNIEVDIFAKYVENFFNNQDSPDITQKMKTWGYKP